MKKALIALCAVFVLFCFRIDYLGERIRTHGADSLHIVDRGWHLAIQYPYGFGWASHRRTRGSSRNALVGCAEEAQHCLQRLTATFR